MANFWKTLLSPISSLGGLFDPQKLDTMDPQQKEIFHQLAMALQGGGGPLADVFGFDPNQVTDLFEKSVAQPAYQQFQENTVPGITGQFRGQNLQNSSYLGGALTKAGTDVQRDLDAQLSSMIYNAQQQALGRKQQGVKDLINTQTFAYGPNPFLDLLKSMAGGAGRAVGMGG